MQKLIDCFVRLKEGEWFCRAPCSLDGPAGPVALTPGVVYRKGRLFMGMDVGAVLEDWHTTGHVPPNISVR